VRPGYRLMRDPSRRWRERGGRPVRLALSFDDIMEIALALLALSPVELEALGWSFADRKRLLDHFLASGKSAQGTDPATLGEVTLTSVLSHPIIVSDHTLTLGPVVTALLERSREPPQEKVVANAIATLKSMVMQGMGASFLTMVDVFEECRSGALRFVPIAGARMYELLSISVRDIKTLNPSAAQMVSIMSSALDELPKTRDQ
jgi:hypothetical protein